ncbi:MAG: hypothetical protein ACAF41_04730 [Leptolyngbya sp. BL-A-14]
MQQRNAMNGKTVGITCKGRSIAVAGLAFVLSLEVLVIGFAAVAAEPTQAAPMSKASLMPDSEPLDIKALQPGNAPAYVVTATRISPTKLSIPSLWWLQEQIANEETYGGNLLDNWLAYPNSGNRPGRVDLVVNRQSWSLLDYLDRYAFIHAFGEAGRDFGYNVRVFDGQATLLGASTCNFSAVNIDALQRTQLATRTNGTVPLYGQPPSSLSSQPGDSISCNILLDSSGKAGLRGGSNQLLPGGGAAKALGTDQR